MKDLACLYRTSFAHIFFEFSRRGPNFSRYTINNNILGVDQTVRVHGAVEALVVVEVALVGRFGRLIDSLIGCNLET